MTVKKFKINDSDSNKSYDVRKYNMLSTLFIARQLKRCYPMNNNLCIIIFNIFDDLQRSVG